VVAVIVSADIERLGLNGAQTGAKDKNAPGKVNPK